VIVLGVSVSFYFSELSKAADLKDSSINVQQSLLMKLLKLKSMLKREKMLFFRYSNNLNSSNKKINQIA